MNTFAEIIVWIENNVIFWIYSNPLIALLWHIIFSVLAGLVCSALVMIKREEGRWGIKKDSLILKIFYGFNLMSIFCGCKITVPDNSCRLIRSFILSFLLSPVIILAYCGLFLTHWVFMGSILFFIGGRIPKTIKFPVAWKKGDYFSLPSYLNPAILFCLSSFYWAREFWREFWREIIRCMSAGLPGVSKVLRTIFAFLTNEYFVGTVLFLVLVYILYKFYPREKTKTVIESFRNKYCIKFVSHEE